MPSKELDGKWALVTGASSGLGADIARELAGRGCNVLLAARRKERLEELARELRESAGVEAESLPADLEHPDAPAELYERASRLGHGVDVLVNNAGFGNYGPFLETDWPHDRALIDVDVAALVHLSKLFGRDMVRRGWGRMLQVASIGAYQACPRYAVYGAAKSFVLHFSEALSYELRGTGVSSTALSPGATATEFFAVAGNRLTAYQRMMMMPSRKVAAAGVRAMLRRRSAVVPGFLNSLLAWSTRLAPRRANTATADLFMRVGQS
jgi:uncharacterized protein